MIGHKNLTLHHGTFSVGMGGSVPGTIRTIYLGTLFSGIPSTNQPTKGVKIQLWLHQPSTICPLTPSSPKKRHLRGRLFLASHVLLAALPGDDSWSLFLKGSLFSYLSVGSAI